MNRRNLIGGSLSALLAGGVYGWHCAARTQQQNSAVIGCLEGPWGRLGDGLDRGLRENGIEGVKFKFSGWSRSNADKIEARTAELVSRQVSLILAFSTQAALAAKTVTTSTPIIFLSENPVANGLVDRLSSPGGNLTGVSSRVSGMITKRIEIMRELVPTAKVVVLATDPTNKPVHEIEVREAQSASKAVGLELSIIEWTGEHPFETELAALPRDRKAVLVFGTGLPFIFGSSSLLAYLAVRYEIPAIFADREAAENGGLASFGPRFEDGAYLMGTYAARILNGEKVADLPVHRIRRTELVINPWPAKSLGLQIPPALLARADEMID